MLIIIIIIKDINNKIIKICLRGIKEKKKEITIDYLCLANMVSYGI